MPVTITFKNGTVREFPQADKAVPRGQGVVLVSADGKQTAFDGPVAKVVVNGEEIEWPSN